MKQKNEELIQKLITSLRTEVLGSVRVLGDKHLTVGFAESCTGGLLSSFFTELPGVSSVFTGSVISYDNKVKQKLLNVSEETLKTKGAVSFETAKEMAEGAVKTLNVATAISITGIAGPNGGSDAKPVGTVFIAVAGAKSETVSFKHSFVGERKAIQLQACLEATKHLNEYLKNNNNN